MGHRSLEVALWLTVLLCSIKITSVLATSQQIKFDENSPECKVEMPTNGTDLRSVAPVFKYFK